VIFFAGRGLMRLWMSGNHSPRGQYFQGHEAYPTLGNNQQQFAPRSVQPMYNPAREKSGIIPIW
jgi:hypothetical protein